MDSVTILGYYFSQLDFKENDFIYFFKSLNVQILKHIFTLTLKRFITQTIDLFEFDVSSESVS